MNRRTRLLLLLVLQMAAGCRTSSGRGAVPAAPEPPPLDAPGIATLIDPRVSQRPAWGEAILNALRANNLPPTAANACAVVAVIAQESGFQTDPVVPGLAKLVQERIERERSRLGLLGKPVFSRLLAGRSPQDPRSFEERLGKVRTERDLDMVFRDMIAFYRGAYPTTFKALALAGKAFDVDNVAELNPITTAGPMQVNVAFAEEWAREHHGRPADVRDDLYTRTGGVYYGTARLFGHPAAYEQPIHRFADYNAGVYASRNAAVQAQLSKLTGRTLVPDGDLMSYDKHGEANDADTATLQAILAFRERYAPRLGERRVRNDVKREKTAAFETTDTYRAIKRAYQERFKQPPAYAQLPNIDIESPKLRGKRSTAWFARSVQRRYEACTAPATRLTAAPPAPTR